MKVTFWGVYESDYPRNRIFIDGIRENQKAVVNTAHVPFFEKTTDKSGSYLSPFSLFIEAIKLKLAYLRLTGKYIKFRKKTDIWVCGYLGQLDVIVLTVLKKLFRDKRPLLFNPLVSLYDTLIGDRGRFPKDGFIAKMLLKMDQRAFDWADHILIDTTAHKKYLVDTFAIAENKISVIWVGAEEVFFHTRVKLPALRQKPFIVQFVGKFIPLHGIDVILDAAKWFKEDEVVFEMIGKGQLEEWFEEAVKERNLTNIRHIPWVPYEELPQKMRESHISLGIFSDSEKALRVVPNKVFQALALGRITITAQSPGVEEIQSRGIPVIAVKPGSGDGLARMIQMVKEGYRDMEGFARQAKKLSRENFSPEILTGQFLDICEKMIAGEPVIVQIDEKKAEPKEENDESESVQVTGPASGSDSAKKVISEEVETVATPDPPPPTASEINTESEKPAPEKDTPETGHDATVPAEVEKKAPARKTAAQKKTTSPKTTKAKKKTTPKTTAKNTAPLPKAKTKPSKTKNKTPKSSTSRAQKKTPASPKPKTKSS